MTNPFKVGEYVKVWFDTGAMGPTILYGRVTHASDKQCRILWESGLVNRLRYSYGTRGVERIEPRELDNLPASLKQ